MLCILFFMLPFIIGLTIHTMMIFIAALFLMFNFSSASSSSEESIMKRGFDIAKQKGSSYRIVVYNNANSGELDFNMAIDPKKFDCIFGLDHPHHVIEFVKKGESLEKNSIFISYEKFPCVTIDDLLEHVKKTIGPNVDNDKRLDSKTIEINSKPFIHNQQGTRKIGKWVLTQGNNDVHYLYVELNCPESTEKESYQRLKMLTKDVLSTQK